MKKITLLLLLTLIISVNNAQEISKQPLQYAITQGKNFSENKSKADISNIAIRSQGQENLSRIPAVTSVVSTASDIDAAITAIVAPPQLGQNLSSTESVTATIKNNGGNVITYINMELTVDNGTPIVESLTSIDIPSGETQNYTFTAAADLSAPGNHTITVRAILAADSNEDNDEMTVNVYNVICNAVTLPYVQDFQDDSYLCWSMISNNNENAPYAPIYPMGLYFSDETNTNLVFGFSSFSYTTDYNQYLITPELPTGSPGLQITFDYFTGSGIYVPELFRIGCSTTTNDIEAFTWGGENTASNAGQSNSLQFSSVVPEGTKYIAINYYSNYKMLLLIDNIVIDQAPTNDAAITAIVTPVANGINLTSTEAVTATIKNEGVNTISYMSIELTVDNGTPIVENLTGLNIASEDTYNYTFSATADLSAEGSHTIKVRTILAGDLNTDNDEMIISVTNTLCDAINTFPWTDSFEGIDFPPSCWSIFHINGTFDWKRTITTVHNGNSAAYHAYSSMGTFVKTALVSPPIAIPNTNLYSLNFYSYIQYTVDYAYSGIWISTTVNNDPAAFSEVKVLSGTEVSSSWQKIALSLAAYAGETIYIAFIYGGEYAHGWAIDDVTIDNIIGNDVAITAVIAPESGINLSTTEAVTATIKNEGGNTISAMSMELTVDDGTPIIETLTSVNIAFGATYDYTFSATADLSSAGNHTVKVRAVLTDDENPANDEMTVTVNNIICNMAQNLPFYENFDASIDLPPCWTTIDENNDDFNWYIDQSWNLSYYPSYNAHSEENFATSQSSYNVSDDIWVGINPDNYLITPLLFIPANGATLKYWVGQTFDLSGNEHYSVLISTTGTDISDFTEIFAEDVFGTEWMQREISLANYANKNIYIAFRHFGCFDIEMLKLDDISVEAATDAVPNNLITNIAVYPNPVINTFIIENAVGSLAKIYDLSGKIMFDSKILNASQKVDISNVSAGVYFLELLSPTSKSTVKLFKK